MIRLTHIDLIRLLVAVAVTVGCSPVFAVDVFSDNFNSSNGPLLGTTPDVGGIWSQTGSNATNPVQISSGTATLVTTGQDVYAGFSSTVAAGVANDFVTSLDLKITAAQTAGDYFLHLTEPLGTTSLFYQRLFARAWEDGYQLGLLDTSGSGSLTTWGAQKLSFGSTYHVDVTWDFVLGPRNDEFSVAVDATPYLTHTWTSSSGEPSQLEAVNLRQGNSVATVPALTLDNLVVSAIQAEPAPFNIFQWKYVDPQDPSQGKLESNVLAGDGLGLHAEPGLDASLRNLRRAHLIGADLTDADFSNSNLTDADLSQANLTNAVFNNANHTGASFAGAEVRGAKFESLAGGDLAQLYSTASYLAHDLTGIGLGGNYMSRANFAGQNLTNATFQNATLSRANFSQANLTDTDLSGANLTGANISGAILTDAIVKNAKLSSTHITLDQLYSTASYENHDLTGVHFVGNDLSGANLAGQHLASASFYAAKLAGADLTNADLTSAELVNADLSQANLTGANFTNATLALANLGHAILTDANFNGANLTGTNLMGADVRGARLGGATTYVYGYVCGKPSVGGCLYYTYGVVSTQIGGGINLAQLNTTANFQAHDLSGIDLSITNLAGANFAGFNLTNANFTGATLTGADLSRADARGTSGLSGFAAPNLIRPDGHIAGLNLSASQTLSIRDYDGSPTSDVLPIRVDEQFAIAPNATLRMIFEADAWDSTISFAPGIPVTLAGTLQLLLAEGVDPISQVGRTFQIFNWTGVTRMGTFAVDSPHLWDVSSLYITGNVTFLAAGSAAVASLKLAVPEPAAWWLLCTGIATAVTLRRACPNRALIAALALLTVPSNLSFAARPDIQLTPIGVPIWKPVDFQLFSAPATPFDATFGQVYNTLLPFDTPLAGTYVPHAPPYDAELSARALVGGYVTKSLFAPAAITLNPNGVYFAYLMVPDPGTTGSSRDFTSGPIIPNAVFPIATNVDVWLDGVLVDRTPGADALIPVQPRDAVFQGTSHLEYLFVIWHPWDDDLTVGPLGNYDVRLSIRDVEGSGWDVVVPFRVAVPGDYDYSGTVGLEDYGVWKDNFGSTTKLDADGNDDHVVDAADYTLWRDNFSTALSSGTGSAGGSPSHGAVPEPATLAPLLLAAVGLCGRLRRAA